MLPAIGLVSLTWAVSCLVLSTSAVPESTYNECCSCITLMPEKRPVNTKPESLPSPFKIHLSQTHYQTNMPVTVTLKATQGYTFRSFILGAYRAGWKEGADVVGELELIPEEKAKVIQSCPFNEKVSDSGRYETYNALVSNDLDRKTEVKFYWTPKKLYGHVEFRATFVMSETTYWVAEKSVLLKDKEQERFDVMDVQRYIPGIDVDSCGKTKGCFREPAGCVEPQCLYILTWTVSGDEITYELGGLADGSRNRYVAFGVSDDIYMGSDTVFTCAHNTADDGFTRVYLSYNKDDPKRNIPVPELDKTRRRDAKRYDFLRRDEGTYFNSRLRCRFTVDTSDLDGLPQPLLSKPKHLLFARGFAVKGSPERHGLGVEELPLATEERVDFGRYKDYSGRASYPLAKAHGCLMILAWIFFASIGLLMTKYYKPMWPNKRIAGQRYWLFTHFNCMALMFLITIIGIILIFVEAGGYSEAPDLPQKAHPILGIIILVCIIINPVLALLRPSQDSDCRPVFNWFHWAFGTIANVLAIPQIFIGMDFGKVMVPWWATWILVIWVIFHIAVELTLEIHQCCMHKKNKERRKKWEQLKREYPKQHHPEPEPAGRRLKSFMLPLHVGVTALITLIMIIIIAVS